MKVSFYTLGCKVNQYETNAIIQKFEASGFQVVPWGEFADIFVINTCTVTNMADRKSRQILRRPKKINKDSIVIAMGCYVQADSTNLDKDLDVDIAVGSDDKENVIDIVKEYLNKDESSLLNTELNTKLNPNKKTDQSFRFKITDIMEKCEFTELGTTEHTDTNRAYIKIQDGCEQYCTYCIIPYVRGRIRSRSKENIIKEVEALVKKGIKEVVLTGIHVASYGKDFNNNYGLINIIEDLNSIQGLERIRLSSIEPTYFTDEILERLNKVNKLCNHFHLSLQSASNSILKKMNRKYTVEEYIEIIENIRKTFSDVMLTTDIIVGFPGETEEDFNTTYENLKSLKFYKIHVFKYSRRKGTIADKMDDQLTDAEKTKRSNIILKLSDKDMEEYMKLYVGKSVDILFEEIKDEYLVGHTTNYIMVNLDINSLKEKNINPDTYLNRINKVEIYKYEDNILYAKA